MSTATITKETKTATFCACNSLTGCGTPVYGKNSRFAPGHDAKLVSFLVSSTLVGSEIATSNGSKTVHVDPQHWAETNLSPALLIKFQMAVDKAQTRAQAREAKAAAKPSKPKRAFEPVEVKIRVGRNLFDAFGSDFDKMGRAQTFTYTNKQGEKVEVAASAVKIAS